MIELVCKTRDVLPDSFVTKSLSDLEAKVTKFVTITNGIITLGTLLPFCPQLVSHKTARTLALTNISYLVFRSFIKSCKYKELNGSKKLPVHLIAEVLAVSMLMTRSLYRIFSPCGWSLSRCANGLTQFSYVLIYLGVMGYLNWSIDKIHFQSKEIENLKEGSSVLQGKLGILMGFLRGESKPKFELEERVASLESDLAVSRRNVEALRKAWKKRLPDDVIEEEAILKYAEQAELCEEKLGAAEYEVFLLTGELKIIESSADFPEKGLMRWAAEGAMMFCQHLKTKLSRLKERPDNEEVSQAGRYIEAPKE